MFEEILKAQGIEPLNCKRYENNDLLTPILKRSNRDIKNNIDKSKKLILFGAGVIGHEAKEYFEDNGFEIYAFCDNRAEQYENLECKIYKPEELIGMKSEINIVTASISFYTDMLQQLVQLGMYNSIVGVYVTLDHDYDEAYIQKNYDNFSKVFSLLQDKESIQIYHNVINAKRDRGIAFVPTKSCITYKQYFDENIITFSEKECFIDGGAFDGDTIRDFTSTVNNRYRSVLAFEPDEENYNVCKKNISDDRIKLYNLGLFDSEKEFRFSSNEQMGSKISYNGNTEIRTTTIDNFYDESPTFIKLDIEGAEIAALKGAEKTIMMHKPKLAICIYHKPDDLWEIPLLIKEMLPEYKLFIRHYSSFFCETVCYAVI